MRRRGFLGSLLGLLALRKVPAELQPKVVPSSPPEPDRSLAPSKEKEQGIYIRFIGPPNGWNPEVQKAVWDAMRKRRQA